MTEGDAVGCMLPGCDAARHENGLFCRDHMMVLKSIRDYDGSPGRLNEEQLAVARTWYAFRLARALYKAEGIGFEAALRAVETYRNLTLESHGGARQDPGPDMAGGR